MIGLGLWTCGTEGGKVMRRDVGGVRNSPGWNLYSRTCRESQRRLSSTPLRVDLLPHKGSECLFSISDPWESSYPFFNSEPVPRGPFSKTNESATLPWCKHPRPSGQGHVTLRSQGTVVGKGLCWARGICVIPGDPFPTEAGP